MSRPTKCIIVDDEPVAREILKTYVAKIPSLELVSCCKNGMEAFETIATESVDLILLDINMPDITGLSLAKSINSSTKIIFTTAYREYAVDGFNLGVVDYLLKPIAFDRFLQAINKYHQSTANPELEPSPASTPKDNHVFVRADRKMVKVEFPNILYIESYSDYLKIVTLDGTITTRETISNMETRIPQSQFCRIHRSYIIRIDKVDSYSHEQVEISQKMLPVSRSYKEQFLNRMR